MVAARVLKNMFGGIVISVFHLIPLNILGVILFIIGIYFLYFTITKANRYNMLLPLSLVFLAFSLSIGLFLESIYEPLSYFLITKSWIFSLVLFCLSIIISFIYGSPYRREKIIEFVVSYLFVVLIFLFISFLLIHFFG
jgi:hypothetical protein